MQTIEDQRRHVIGPALAAALKLASTLDRPNWRAPYPGQIAAVVVEDHCTGAVHLRSVLAIDFYPFQPEGIECS